MELLGRTLEDARLVALAYAFEQATDHRREPWSTPPLVDRRAPGPYTVALGRAVPTDADVDVGLAGTLSWDPVRRELTYDVSVSGPPGNEIAALALRWPDGEGGWQVAHRLSGPGRRSAAGVVRLSAAQAGSLERGDVQLVVVDRRHAGATGGLFLTVRAER
jgi:hypothetical protein